MKLFLKITLLITTLATTNIHAYLHWDFQDGNTHANQNREAFLELYNKYLDEVEGLPNAWLELKEVIRINKIALENSRNKLKEALGFLDIELSLEEIHGVYEQHGIIQLRPINQQIRSLVICCGKHPLTPIGIAEFSQPFEEDLGDYIRQNEQYRVKHLHEGCITLDQDPLANPTILSFFGIHTITIFPDIRFSEIWLENHPHDMFHIQGNAKTELDRLLDGSGNLFYGDTKEQIEIDQINDFARYPEDDEEEGVEMQDDITTE